MQRMLHNRINWIDWAKAIAIYAVVLGHVSENTDPSWTVEMASIGRIFHVPLFFFVSGYLFRVKETRFYNFSWNSAKSLIVPYFFFNLVSAAILWKLQAPNVYLNGFYGFLLAKGYAFAGPAWFLIALFFVRIIAYWVQKLNSAYIKWGVTLVLIVFVGISSVKIDMGISSAMLAYPFFFWGGVF